MAALLGYRDLRQLVDIDPVGDDICRREVYLQVGGNSATRIHRCRTSSWHFGLT